MENNEMFGDIIAAVKELIPEDIRDLMDVSVQEVMKNNDRLMHGVVIRGPGQDIAPAVYIEECVELLPDDASIEDLAESIVATYLKGMMEAPDVQNISLKYEDVSDKFEVQVIDAARNKDRLQDLIYRSLDNGMVMIAYVVIEQNEHESLRAAVTKGLAESENYDVDKVFEQALANTMRKNAPVMTDITSMIMNMADFEHCNPLEEDFAVSPGSNLYVLSNEHGSMGASALYYPDVMKNIGEALQDDYYVLMSSQHEVIVVPEKAGTELEFLKAMVKDANNTVVHPRDVLSDKVLKYDRAKEKLYEPEERAKTGADRGDR